jgi:hypothetical protein
MQRTFALAGLIAALVVGGLIIAGSESKAFAPVTAEGGALPAKWKELGLSDAQKKEIYGIQAEYHRNILDLEAQIKKLRTEEQEKLIKVLTDDQKKRLREIKDPIPEKSSGSGSSSASGSTSKSSASESSK